MVVVDMSVMNYFQPRTPRGVQPSRSSQSATREVTRAQKIWFPSSYTQHDAETVLSQLSSPVSREAISNCQVIAGSQPEADLLRCLEVKSQGRSQEATIAVDDDANSNADAAFRDTDDSGMNDGSGTTPPATAVALEPQMPMSPSDLLGHDEPEGKLYTGLESQSLEQQCVNGGQKIQATLASDHRWHDADFTIDGSVDDGSRTIDNSTEIAPILTDNRDLSLSADITPNLGQDARSKSERGLTTGQLDTPTGARRTLSWPADAQARKLVSSDEGPQNPSAAQFSCRASNVTDVDEDEDIRPPAKRRQRCPRHPIQAETFSGLPASTHEDGPAPVRSDIGPGQFRDPSPDHSLAAAEFQEWSVCGSLKCTAIGNEMFWNLEFTSPRVSGCIGLPVGSVLSTLGDSTVSSSLMTNRRATQLHARASSMAKEGDTSRRKWTAEEDSLICRMKRQGCGWDEIHVALPHRTKGSIQVRYSTKLR